MTNIDFAFGANTCGYVSGDTTSRISTIVLVWSSHNTSIENCISFIQIPGYPSCSKTNNIPSSAPSPGRPDRPFVREAWVSATVSVTCVSPKVAWAIHSSLAECDHMIHSEKYWPKKEKKKRDNNANKNNCILSKSFHQSSHYSKSIAWKSVERKISNS